MKEQKSGELWKPFIVNISLVAIVFILGIFVGLIVRNKQLIESEILSRARAHFKNIVLTRRWNANYGGVYVEKKEGVVSNPYLENPDLEAVDGTIYTMKNPALMTREISEYAREEGFFYYHITSLTPLNPENSPDGFEKKALKSFEGGTNEVFSKENQNRTVYFRYMAPLVTEESCLECHAKQGYQLGDIRGGISVKFDISNIEKALQSNTYLIIGFGIVTAALFLGLIYFFIIRLMKNLRQVEEERENLIIDLQKAIDEVKTLQGLIPICAACKKIRDDRGLWEQIEEYISERADVKFSHSICPDCRKELYPK
jgi:preprotein translocase subunit YajC